MGSRRRKQLIAAEALPDLRCIFCLRDSTEAPPEHIIPESLGCPEAAILRMGEVCEECNHGMGHLDQALGDSFDMARLIAGQPGKKGRGTRVTGRSNFRARVARRHATIEVNLGPGDITLPDGHVLKAPDNSPTSVHVEVTSDGVTWSAKHRAQALHHPKFVRAMHKVAVETIASMLGRSAALDASLDEARRYVFTGDAEMSRGVLCFPPPAEWRYENRLWPPYKGPEGLAVAVRLAGFEFAVDCTPKQYALARMLDALSFAGYDRGWTVVRDPARK